MPRQPKNQPMSVPDMVEMESAKLGHYKVEADKNRKNELSALIQKSLVELVDAASKDKIELTNENLEEIQKQTALYIKSCAEVGIPPSIEGLCLGLGYSRSGLYKFLESHPNSPVADWLEKVSDSFANIIDVGAMMNQLAPAPSIFRLKSVHNRRETVELVAAAPANPLGTPRSMAEIQAFADAMPED